MADRTGELLPDPAHAVAMAEGAEGLEVPERMGPAADRRLPEVEMRCIGTERGVAPGAPAALPLEDGLHGLVRDVRPRNKRIVGTSRYRCSALAYHPEKLFFQMISLSANLSTECRTVRLRQTASPDTRERHENPGATGRFTPPESLARRRNNGFLRNLERRQNPRFMNGSRRAIPRRTARRIGARTPEPGIFPRNKGKTYYSATENASVCIPRSPETTCRW